VDQLYDRALQMQASLNPDPAILAKLYRDIRYELTNLSAQSIMRGIDNPLAVRRAMADGSAEIDALLDRMQAWSQLRTEIFKATEKGARGLPCIVQNMYELAMQNFEFYRMVAAGYAKCAEGISPPPAPLRPLQPRKPGGYARTIKPVRRSRAATQPKAAGRHTRNGAQPSRKRAREDRE
jgi:hypothetical protein